MAVAAGLVLAMALAAVFAGGGAAPASSHLKPASGSDPQWAFGGVASATYSCSGASCGEGSEISSISLTYYIEWVVIYSSTAISASQTEFEALAAINATANLSINGCIQETNNSPCTTLAASANLAGRETAAGFTNITNTGQVYLTAGSGAPGDVAALAATDSQSTAAFNFSGKFAETLSGSGTTGSDSVSFDFGGNEATSVTFGTPLGILPTDPSPGQSWTASAPYSASGQYTSGYSLSETVDGVSNSTASWGSINMNPSGTLVVNGTDLGAVTLYDNYTSPPTTATAQAILLSFSGGEFTATDGWLIIPSGLYDDIGGAAGISGVGLVAGPHPAAGTEGGNESAYYQSGTGFVGASEAVASSSLGQTGGPSLNLNAGPEPVNVAQQQYNAITASPASSSFPWIDLVAAVVVVLVVVVVVTLVALRSRRRRPPAAGMPPTGAMPPGNMPGGPSP